MAQWYLRANDFARSKTTCQRARNTLRRISISSHYIQAFQQGSFLTKTYEIYTSTSRSCYRIMSLVFGRKKKFYPRRGRHLNYLLQAWVRFTICHGNLYLKALFLRRHLSNFHRSNHRVLRRTYSFDFLLKKVLLSFWKRRITVLKCTINMAANLL